MVINSPCLTDKEELAIPGKTTTGKELSNSLMVGSLPKTTLPTQLTVITEASIRHDLKLNDAEGTSCLPNAVIFKELARMGTIASTIICLANNQKFNFSKYILDNLKKNLEAGVPFYIFLRAVMPLFGMVQAVEEDHVPTLSNYPLPSGEDMLQLKELMVLCTNLSNKERKIADIYADAEVNLENVYNLDMAYEETVLSMQDVTDADGKEVYEEIVEVIITAKIIVDEVSTAGVELNAANKEPVKDKGKAKLVEEHEVLKLRKAQIAIDKEVVRRIEVEWNAYMQDNIDWNEVVE
uniref:Uncharacterized protein n=1 Tax=Tanacetum cinerariifolium TaxID=118510 RepID=A0A6L2N3E7_TANCI|nr:hypothetical protein [Tanacetum cinerariifolium]